MYFKEENELGKPEMMERKRVPLTENSKNEENI